MEIRIAKIEDIEKIRSLIEKRIEWMNENNIKHWNMFDYLNIFSYDYFKDKVKEGNFYVAIKDNIVVGAVLLVEEDKAWNDDIKALYIHNLVGDINTKGVGKILLDYAERKALERNIYVLRLDAKIDDDKLNKYYELQGYKKVGICKEGEYTGYKMEKKVRN